MKNLKKIEIEFDDSLRYLKSFKINGKKYGSGITSVDIHLESFKNKVSIFGNTKIVKKLNGSELYDIKGIDMYRRVKDE